MTTEQQLPEGWKKTTLGAEFEWSSGGTPKSGVPAYYENGSIHWLNISDLNDGLISYAEKKITELGLQESSAKIVPQGSVLIAIYGSIGKLGINTIPLATNQAICFTKKIPEYILNKFLFYYLLSIRNQLISMGKGGTQQNISQTVLKSVPFFYPTSKETQQAIVNKIESLFDEIDEGIGRLKTAAQQIQQYRQSLLKNAFNGELTKEWRSKHADALPSENELLAQIQTTREQHHAQQLADWQTAVSQWEQNGKEGKKPSRPSTLKKLESIEKLNEIELTELPDGWFWERLGLMTLGVEYGTSAKSQPEGKVPVLRMGNMQNGKIDWTDLVYSDNDEEIKQYLLKKGDVLFNRTNSPELVGKTSIIETDEKAIFAGYLIRINHLKEITDGRYLTYFLNSMIAKKYGNFVKTDGVNQSNINGQKLINYPFVFCSLKEQKEVADILEQKLTACDQLAAELAKQLKQAELLKQAVLKAAFSGNLLDK